MMGVQGWGPPPAKGIRVYSTITVEKDRLASWLNDHREWVPVAVWSSGTRGLVNALVVKIEGGE